MEKLILLFTIILCNACTSNSPGNSNTKVPDQKDKNLNPSSSRIIEPKLYKTITNLVEDYRQPLKTAVFSPDGKKVAISSGKTQVYSLDPWSLDQVLDGTAALGFSEDSKFINAVVKDTYDFVDIGQFDLNAKKWTSKPIKVHLPSFRDDFISFSKDGNYAFYQDFEINEVGSDIRIFDIKSGAEFKKYHYNGLQNYSVSKNGKYFATMINKKVDGESKNLLTVKNFKDDSDIFSFEYGDRLGPNSDPVFISADGNQVVFCQEGVGKSFIYNILTKKMIQFEVNTFVGCQDSYDFSPDGHLLIMTNYDEYATNVMNITIVDTSTGATVINVPTKEDRKTNTHSAVAFSLNGEYFFVSEKANNEVHIYKVYQDTPDFNLPSPINPNPTPSPLPPIDNLLKLVIENSFIMNQPQYLLAKKSGDIIKIYFVSYDFSEGRQYLLCSDNLGDLGLKETVGIITVPVTSGTYRIPANNTAAKVNISKNLVYMGFQGSINISDSSNGSIFGFLNLSAKSAKGDSTWTGAFQGMVCSEEESFFRSKNLLIMNKKTVLKSLNGSIPGNITLKASNGNGAGGNLQFDFSPDKIPGTNYYPKGVHFEMLVELRGGQMLNQNDKIVGEYSDTKLTYSTANGAYSQLVDPFDLQIDYTDENRINIKIVTPQLEYEVAF